MGAKRGKTGAKRVGLNCVISNRRLGGISAIFRISASPCDSPAAICNSPRYSSTCSPIIRSPSGTW